MDESSSKQVHQIASPTAMIHDKKFQLKTSVNFQQDSIITQDLCLQKLQLDMVQDIVSRIQEEVW